MSPMTTAELIKLGNALLEVRKDHPDDLTIACFASLLAGFADLLSATRRKSQQAAIFDVATKAIRTFDVYVTTYYPGWDKDLSL